MDDETAAAATRYVPHDLVMQILLRLPVESLMRFTCVSKAWHDTITGDQSFQRQHLCLQQTCVLIAPWIRINYGGHPYERKLKVTTPGLYRWEMSQDAATVVLAMDSFPVVEAGRRHNLAHCDGLVLVSMDDNVWVLNPATRHVLPLPQSCVTPRGLRRCFDGALGLGHDPHSNTYKVARFYYPSVDRLKRGGYHYTLGMEVFTIGRDRHWRETAAPPPYPIMAGRTATFFKGSLLWTIDESLLLPGDVVPARGSLRFSLNDESFSVIPAPPGCPDLRYATSNLAEFHGELCVAHEGPKHGSFRSACIWVCNDVDGSNPPRWVQRHVMNVPRCIHLVATSNDDILFQGGSYNLMCSDSQSTLGVRHVAIMHDLAYHHPNTNTLVKYTSEIVYDYDIIPYVPSLMPI
ncbi:hypothetical protein VPH35_018940 [Triticum aestivum]